MMQKFIQIGKLTSEIKLSSAEAQIHQSERLRQIKSR